MNFFEIRKYSGRNFNLVQENHFLNGVCETRL